MQENNSTHNENAEEMYRLIKRLFPICRSITGNGLRETLKIMQEYIPLEIMEVPTGTEVYDWTVPKEWNIKDAYIKNSNGDKIIDFKKSNIHVLGYSVPVNKKMTLTELKEHLFTIPEHPDWVPYVISYYKQNWGFCLTHNQFLELKDDIYEVVIDSKLEDGSLTYGEYYIKGEMEDELLFSSYICHPSLCNDNLSGPVLITFLGQYLKELKLKYSYRFLFVPETIGAITWLSRNEQIMPRIKGGIIATCVCDSGIITYKRSKSGNALIDTIAEKVLIDAGETYRTAEFNPADGSDERQFSSPGFNLPVGSLMRTIYGDFPEYHTSADNLDIININNFTDMLQRYIDIVYIFENNGICKNLFPKCEPQLGKRGLYRSISTKNGISLNDKAMFWILNFADGKHSLLDIANKSGIDFKQIKNTADILMEKGLVRFEKNV